MNFNKYVPDKHKNNHMAVILFIHAMTERLLDTTSTTSFVNQCSLIKKIKYGNIFLFLNEQRYSQPLKTELDSKQIDDLNNFLDEFFRFYAEYYWKE